MKLRILFTAALYLGVLGDIRCVVAQGTTFTYQGELSDSGGPLNGLYDLTFTLFDGPSGAATQVGLPQTLSSVQVSAGLFTTSLNFGDGIFTGGDRWLQIAVHPHAGGPTTTLGPRQQLTPTPYAVHAAEAGALSGVAATAYVAKTGDTMTGPLTLPANGLVVGGSQLVTLGGNIGIGTTVPTDTLDVNGGFRVSGSTTATTGAGVEIDYNVIGPRIFAFNRDTGVFQDFGIGDFSHGKGVMVRAGGNVGIGNNSPLAPLDISAAGADVSGRTLMRFSYSSTEYDSISAFFNGNPGNSGLGFNVEYQTGDIRQIMTLKGNAVGIGTTSPAATLHVLGSSAPGANIPTGTAVLASGSGDGGNNRFMSVEGDQAVYMQMYGAGGYGEISTYDYATGTGLPLKLNANGGTVIVPVLQINGADVAEPFDLSTKDIPKGSVVTIDEENSGQLKQSDHAYDKRVAGILSGANGVHPGIRLKQEGFNDHGEEVALSGRVYALADAHYGAIKPGDLLTTSDTPGHCMTVTDHARAQGAIIGKAMSTLKEGKGMVLVLVSLQ